MFTVFGFGCKLGASQTTGHAAASIKRHSLHRINAQHIDAGKLQAAVAELITHEFTQGACKGGQWQVVL
nr:Tn3 family transposase [Thiorhodococcus mannitoliphagus]